MAVSPSDIIPKRQVPEITTGPVVAVGVGSVSVRLRPDLVVLISTAQQYAVGQMVSVAIPSGNLSSAQIIGGASGSAPRIRYVAV
jgi:hypothetical protein